VHFSLPRSFAPRAPDRNNGKRTKKYLIFKEIGTWGSKKLKKDEIHFMIGSHTLENVQMS